MPENTLNGVWNYWKKKRDMWITNVINNYFKYIIIIKIFPEPMYFRIDSTTLLNWFEVVDPQKLLNLVVIFWYEVYAQFRYEKSVWPALILIANSVILINHRDHEFAHFLSHFYCWLLVVYFLFRTSKIQ